MKKYIRHRTQNVLDVKDLTALEYLDFEGKYKGYRENHDFFELCYVESGAISLHLEDKSLDIAEGSTVIIPPNMRHSYSSPAGNLSRAFVICFECLSQTLGLISARPIPADEGEIFCLKTIIREYPKTYRMNSRELLELIPSPAFGGQQAIILQLEYLLISLMRRNLSSGVSEVVLLSGERFHSDLVKIIKDYLRSNVRNKIDLADVCSYMNYSRSFICKIFKAQTGETVITYFNRLKINEGRRLLAETDKSIGEIAEMLGFSEAKYFGASFKKELGISPTEHRAEAKKGK